MIRSVTYLLLSGIYIINGWGAFYKPGGRPKLVAAAGIPRAEQAVVLNGGLMVVAGMLLCLGIAPRVTAALLVGSMIPTTIVGHPFWKEEPGPQRQNQQTQFLKNLSMIGGLLMVLMKKDG
ncbi:MAG TPA: DoxX family protein [Ktedonobacteraceae bacterium]